MMYATRELYASCSVGEHERKIVFRIGGGTLIADFNCRTCVQHTHTHKVHAPARVGCIGFECSLIEDFNCRTMIGER